MNDPRTQRFPVLDNPRMLIGADWVADGTGGRLCHNDPSTGQPLGSFPVAGQDQVDAAISAAKKAYGRWRKCPLNARRDVLLAAAEGIARRSAELAAIAARETGAVFNPTAPTRAAEHLTYYAGWIDKLNGYTADLGPAVHNYSTHEPYGVVACLTAWNGPITSALMKLAPALAAGNCVVLKPPEYGPFATLVLAEIFRDAGLPDGVLNVVTGGAATGAALVRDPRIGKVSFTGGLPTARHVMRAAAENATPVIMELGGKSANLIFADADLERACVMAARMGCMTHSGQGCLFPTRLLVDDRVYDAVVQRVLAEVAKARVGNPFTSGITSGPVINEGALNRIMDAISRAKDHGSATLLTGGERLGGDLAGGYFVQPTVFGDVDNSCELAQNEVFGPVLSLVRFRDEAEATALANDTNYGLAAYVHTRDLSRAHRVASELEAGYVGVNGFPPMPVQAPFGGYKQSGFGREGGRWGIEEYLRLKNVYIALN